MYYKPKYFEVKELVPKRVFEKFGSQSLMFLNPQLLIVADAVRELIGVPATCNNWHVGGEYQNRGFRDCFSKIGSEYSQHRLGNALDLSFSGVPADEVRKKVLENIHLVPFNLIKGIELEVSWFHFDLRNIEKLLLFNP